MENALRPFLKYDHVSTTIMYVVIAVVCMVTLLSICIHIKQWGRTGVDVSSVCERINFFKRRRQGGPDHRRYRYDRL